MNSITCIDLEKFEDFESFQKFIKKNKKYETLFTRGDKNHILSYHNVFYKVAKIWIVDNFVISLQNRGDDEYYTNPELDSILEKESVDVLDRDIIEYEEKVNQSEIKLDMDSILDRINEIGINSLTKEEKDFLNKNNI